MFAEVFNPDLTNSVSPANSSIRWSRRSTANGPDKIREFDSAHFFLVLVVAGSSDSTSRSSSSSSTASDGLALPPREVGTARYC